LALCLRDPKSQNKHCAGTHSVPVLVDSHFSPKPRFVDTPAAKLVRGTLLLKADLSANSSDLSWKVVSLLTKSERIHTVRYLLTESNNLLINGVASFTFSTRAGWLETLPFRILYSVSPWILTNKAVGKFGLSCHALVHSLAIRT
jgi:hypothetical protein